MSATTTGLRMLEDLGKMAYTAYRAQQMRYDDIRSVLPQWEGLHPREQRKWMDKVSELLNVAYGLYTKQGA